MATMEVKLVAEKVDSQMWMTEEAAADAATNQALADVIKRQLEAQAEKFIATSVLAAKAVCIEHGSVEYVIQDMETDEEGNTYILDPPRHIALMRTKVWVPYTPPIDTSANVK